ncbi:MAG: hypothetical protein LiPW30_589 [Parcubacteria group bacterium LiPW_30]|nr:MAG: hypothetical protein LiPW30_589 [Parcubacteria group bacterium LiPW_30]
MNAFFPFTDFSKRNFGYLMELSLVDGVGLADDGCSKNRSHHQHPDDHYDAHTPITVVNNRQRSAHVDQNHQRPG